MIKIDAALLNVISDNAQKSNRKRMNLNFHHNDADRLQRFINAIEPYSYIQPHKHENPDKREVFFILKGKMLVVEFDDDGNVLDHIILDAEQGNFAVEIPEKTWHTILSLEKSSVAYEFKDGPYAVADDKNFAVWAPKEGDPLCKAYIDNLLENLQLQIQSF
ncbi:MAG: WbuC family cupin fold metalloprotein [Bacteroidales bacterium]